MCAYNTGASSPDDGAPHQSVSQSTPPAQNILRIFYWVRGRTLPGFEVLWIVVPVDLTAEGVALHLVEVGRVRANCPEELAPHQLPLQRDGRAGGLLRRTVNLHHLGEGDSMPQGVDSRPQGVVWSGEDAECGAQGVDSRPQGWIQGLGV
eukprot:2832367-Pyramimonas_sp.AAC.1